MSCSRTLAGAAGALAIIPVSAAAHGEAPHDPSAALGRWNFGLMTVFPLAFAAWFYTRGVARVWSRSGLGRGISRKRVAAFAGGWSALVIALISPLDAAAGALFSVHMLQHLLLILVAPPLIIVGAPDVALLWALPPHLRAAAARLVNRLGRRLSGPDGTGPLIIVLVATATLWIWHLPSLYDLAVRNEVVHWAEHATFLVTALLFWATVLRLRPGDHVDNGLRILYVCGMVLQGSLLGALLTFAGRPLYQSHAETPAAWGLTPLADQQIAGLLMWVPPAVLYFSVIAFLFVQWLAAVGRRQEARERATGGPALARGKSEG